MTLPFGKPRRIRCAFLHVFWSLNPVEWQQRTRSKYKTAFFHKLRIEESFRQILPSNVSARPLAGLHSSLNENTSAFHNTQTEYLLPQL